MLLSTFVFSGTATIRFLDKIPCPLFNVLEVSPSAALCSCGGTLSVVTDFCGPAGRPRHQDPHLSRRKRGGTTVYLAPNDAADSLNLYDVSGIAHHELYHALTQT